jgi:predicted phage baseplate assembly protein
MPIPLYNLDDRSFDDLVNEMLARIPGHTPEWTNPRLGDPGRTLIELFAWLADTVLYRANLIPERQRLAFLRLLNIPMRAAIPATGLVALEMANEKLLKPVSVPVHTTVKGPVDFETCGEISVLPLAGQVYVKRRPTAEEMKTLQQVVVGLESVYDVDAGSPYIATPLFSDGLADQTGFDFVSGTVDGCLWVALQVSKAENLTAVRTALGRDSKGAKVLNVGLQPRLKVPQFDEDVTIPASIRDVWDWEITSSRTTDNGEPEYLSLDVVLNTTAGFSRQGLIRLELPDRDDIGVPENDVAVDVNAGVGNRPPRIDDSAVADRTFAWLRLRPVHHSHSLALSWIGINAVEVDQRKTLAGVTVATSNGAADQIVQLPGQSVEPDSLKLQVEEEGRGFNEWQRIDDLQTADRDDRVFQLDSEAGTVIFGNGVRGKVPVAGMRIRVEKMRYGGGVGGNLAAGNLSAITHAGLKATQPVATAGGADAESLDEAEKRIPAFLKHRDRAVTEDDFKQLAAETPAVEIGRVEVLPKFKPQQRRENIPGVVSVMVLPKAATRLPPNPRPDRIILERVHSFLDTRRPLATEMYVMGVEYLPIGLAVAVRLRDGHARDRVLQTVRDALRDYLWSLAPGGSEGDGWPLGQAVIQQELEVVVARVSGVRVVRGVNLFTLQNAEWVLVEVDPQSGVQRIGMLAWQLPELLGVVVADSDDVPTDLKGSNGLGSGVAPDAPPGIPIPVVPEVC